ncbi:RNA 2',3'-cyclic phosphodiesterase [Candidatus Palauibacter soopunensis]|uniref:RNA 2',3'-cyclic phosphodiesterase n=1 Tax=Candidatus Palauibacter soopunensis TaxID=3056739 RepID=UPI00287727EA|nr:RNA 2',3'-cyclic phosphodiesterase [Candidatus Palauibacter soopunensis]
MAILLPSAIRADLARATAALRALEGVRPVRAEQLHLTLRFIGEVDRGLEAPLAREIAAATEAQPGFPIRLGGAGVFPSHRRARVVWVGVEETPDLAALQRSVEEAVVRAGVAPDPRRFRPHVTVGRIRRPPPPVGLAGAIARVRFETTVDVRRVSLMRSELLPRGARHTEVAASRLAGGADDAGGTDDARRARR